MQEREREREREGKRERERETKRERIFVCGDNFTSVHNSTKNTSELHILGTDMIPI